MKSLKQNNKGISLIEIIVTVSIIAIVVVPLISGFFTAMEINSDSRRIQNATYIAQDVMEIVKAKDIDALMQYSVDTYNVQANVENKTDSMGRNFPKYTFSGWDIIGADTEDFEVEVIVDSSTYASFDGSVPIKNPVNSITKPEFSSLFGSDVIMLFKQYTTSDNQLQSYFRALGTMTEAELRTVGPTTVKKSTNMSIVCDYQSSTGLYNYNINLEIVYTHTSGETVTVNNTVNKTYNTMEGHAIYFMMTPYDNASTTLGSTGSGFYASDKLNISYSYNGGLDKKPILGLFITQQYISHKTNPEMVALIDSKNITYEGLINMYNYDNASKSLKIYTNIDKSTNDTGAGNIYGITESTKSDSTLLYDVIVNVKYEGEVIASFSGSKED